MIATNSYLYILKASTIKRKILLSSLMGLTYSKANETELVIHIEDEPDIHFKDSKRDEIVEAIRHVYYILNQRNLRIYFQHDELEGICTKEQDVQYGVNILPSR